MFAEYWIIWIMQRIAPTILLVAATIILASCGVHYHNTEQPAYQTIKPGHILQLNQSLTIPAEEAAVYIQFGKLTHPKHIKDRSPNCRLVVNELSQSETVIQPDSFTVQRITYDTNFVLTNPIMYAARYFRSVSQASATAEVFTTYIHLHSDK